MKNIFSGSNIPGFTPRKGGEARRKGERETILWILSEMRELLESLTQILEELPEE